MPLGNQKAKRDLFEIENAKNLTRDELVATFVPIKAFWRLLSAKNHVILGARGSGKTALAKMLSFDHLSQLPDDKAEKIVQTKSFIGIYLPTNIEWIGALQNKPWQTESEAEAFFQWSLNITACLAFLTTLRACLETYIPDLAERADTEKEIALELCDSWLGKKIRCETVRSLHNYLEDLQYSKQIELNRSRIRRASEVSSGDIDIAFGLSLFAPLRRGIIIASRKLDFPDYCTWMLCIDEAEFLTEAHHRILNSFLRAHSGNLVFKIATMPYFHHTLKTNIGAPLNVGDDFEYVYIDEDPVSSATGKGTEEGEPFAAAIFNKRVAVSQLRYKPITLKELAGQSILLDRKENEWFSSPNGMALLKKYANEDTIKRAERLYGDRRAFMDQIGRKITGALLVREAVSLQKGREFLDIYSGDKMVVRCSDSNPRRLIRIFNSLLSQSRWIRSETRSRRSKDRKSSVSAKDQTQAMISFSRSVIARIRSEPKFHGPDLYEFLHTIGRYFQYCLHTIKLSTDQVYSIRIDRNISDEVWELVKSAVALGLLYPNVSKNRADQMPYREGIFHFAYILAPYFLLFPRRGSAVNLSTILRAKDGGLEDQLSLFDAAEKGK